MQDESFTYNLEKGRSILLFRSMAEPHKLETDRITKYG